MYVYTHPSPFVDKLGDANHVVIAICDGHAQDGACGESCQLVHVRVEACILVCIGDVEEIARLCHVSGNPSVNGKTHLSEQPSHTLLSGRHMSEGI